MDWLNDPKYRSKVDKHYKDLMAYCQVQQEALDKELPPPREDLQELLKARGVSRREFIAWTSLMTAALMLPPMFEPAVAKAAENFSRLPIIWLHLAECTGCSESLLRSSYPNVDDILLETISLEYHETIMAAAGHQAEECLEKAMKDFKRKYICVVEGAIPRAMGGMYLRIGPEGKTGIEIAKKVCSKAAATICIGSCSHWGGIPAAKPNPTDCVGVGTLLGKTTVNIAGCPPNVVNFVGTLLYYLMFKGLPPLDNQGRPLWAYGKRIHDYCERRPHYDASEFVEQWGDEGAKNGWCLYKVGCKGPYTYANCAKVRFNDGISWPIMAGHGCIGCTEPGFWDTMAPLEKPIQDDTIIGDGTADKIGLVLTGATVAGVAAHAVASAIRHKDKDKHAE